MLQSPHNLEKRSLDRQSVQVAAGAFACTAVSAPARAAKWLIVGGLMDLMATFQHQDTFGCPNSISSTTISSVPTISDAEPVSVTIPAGQEPQAIQVESGVRIGRPQSPARVKQPNTAGHTVAQIVRAAAANPMTFNLISSNLIAQAKRAFPEIAHEIDCLIQAAIVQALTCDAVPAEGDAAAFLSKRLFSRIRDYKRSQRTRARLNAMYALEISTMLGRQNAAIDMPRPDPDEHMVNTLHRLRMCKRALKLMSGRERLAFDLFMAGSPAANSGLHRHNLRRALDKVEGMARK